MLAWAGNFEEEFVRWSPLHLECQLFNKGINKIAQKVGEEALETVIEATNGTDEHLVYEASDLLYHLLVLLTEKNLRIEDVAAELRQRHDPEWDKKRREAKAAGKMK